MDALRSHPFRLKSIRFETLLNPAQGRQNVIRNLKSDKGSNRFRHTMLGTWQHHIDKIMSRWNKILYSKINTAT